MRKLTPIEARACHVVACMGGSIVPSNYADEDSTEIIPVLDTLVKKKRARVETTDGGNRYHLTEQGYLDAEA